MPMACEVVREKDARTFLASYLGHDIGPVIEVGAGAWSQCFGFTDAGLDQVIRFGATDDDFRKDERATAFSSVLLPVPEITDIGEAFDGHFAISTRCFGEPLESATASEWPALLPSVFALLDALRGIDVSDSAGYGGWDRHGHGSHQTWAEFLLAVDVDTEDRRTHGWTRKLAESPVGMEPFTAGLNALRHLVVDLPDSRHVIHADLLNRNVLVQDGRISGVFDWGCAAYGDPLYDLAWLEFWSPWHEGIASTDTRHLALAHWRETGVHIDAAEERLRCCLLHIGLDHQAYCAHTGDHDNLIRVTQRTSELI